MFGRQEMRQKGILSSTRSTRARPEPMCKALMRKDSISLREIIIVQLVEMKCSRGRTGQDPDALAGGLITGRVGSCSFRADADADAIIDTS
jgi:hypothetical protein